MAKNKKNREPISNKWYVEIDECFLDTGEIKLIGEPINVAQQEQKIPRGGFEIAYMSALFDLFDRLGGKKYTVLRYILDNRDGMNCLNMTNTELAEKAGVGRNTVVDTIKILSEAGVVTRKGTVLRLSPRLFVKGNAQKEAYIMRKFTEEREQEQQIKGQLRLVGDGSIQEEGA